MKNLKVFMLLMISFTFMSCESFGVPSGNPNPQPVASMNYVAPILVIVVHIILSRLLYKKVYK